MSKQIQLRENILKEISSSNLDKTDILCVLDEVENIIFRGEDEKKLTTYINDELRKLKPGEKVEIDIMLDDDINEREIAYQLNLLNVILSLREVNSRLDIMKNLLKIL